MPLESGTYINDLTASNPAASDAAGQGDDHLRLIKSVLQNTLPNMGGVFGQARVLSTTQTISAVWNTELIVDSTAALALTLPAVASITAGWYVNLMTRGAGTIILTPQAGSSINGGATFTLPTENYGIVVFQGGTTWLASAWPNGTGVANFPNGVSISGAVAINGAVSISGASVFNGAASFNGAQVSISGALDVNGATVLDGTFQANGATFSVSGAATFKGVVSVSGSMVVATTNSFDSSGVHIVRAAGGPTLELSGPTGVHRQILLESAGVQRWRVSADSSAEGGSDTGSSFAIVAYTDAGVFKNAALLISRADSSSVFGGPATFPGTVTISGQAVLSTTLLVNGGADLRGTVSISGLATLNNVAINGNITTGVTISGATVLQSTLTVNGAATISGLATFTTDVAINGNITTGVTISGQAVLNGLTVQGTATISGTLELTRGQIKFPASQVASSNVNVLDDYEEGTWTPTISFATLGDLSVAYSVRLGTYTKIGDTVNVWCRVFTSTFTFTTASGNLQVTGLPFASVANASHIQALSVGPLTGIGFPATYTQTCCAIYGNGSTTVLFTGTDFQTGRNSLNLVQTNATSGSQKDICFGGTYKAS